MNHFDEMTCMLYLDGQLEPARARELAAHVGDCAECRALLGALEGEGRWLRQALVEEEESVPARLMEPPARAPMPWGWIAAFGFGAAGVYTLWNGMIEPWRQQLSQAGFSEGNMLTMLFFGGTFWKGWDTVRTLFEFFAMGTLGIILLALLRRNLRRWTTVAVVMGALACALALPTSASAAEEHSGMQNYTLASGETVKNDLILHAQTVRIEGNVDGDLIVFAQRVAVGGHISGDVLAFAQEARIEGQIDGNLRVFAQTLTLGGQVGKNVTGFVNTVEFSSKSQVGRNAYLFSALATIDGRVARDVRAFCQNTYLGGFVGGAARVIGLSLTIGSSAEIQGRATFRGGRQPEVASGAKLASPLEVEITRQRPEYASARHYWHQALSWGAAFLFGLVLILLAPGFFSDVVRSSRRYGPAFGFGALLLFATPILALIACITIVGLAVGLGTLLLYLIALYSAQVFVGAWLGERILGAGVGPGAALGRLALGLLVLRILRDLPYLGGWITLAVILWGLGALALTLYKSVRPQPAVA